MKLIIQGFQSAKDTLGFRTLVIFIALILIRFISLGLYPLMDTTEGRYGEIARKMATMNDWVTPWFDIGVPFWGKPPLSFWVSAASIKLFGVNEFAVRFPHFLAAALVAAITFDWAKRCQINAFYALVILASSFLFLVSSGAVMTDMVLCVGSTLSLRGFWLSVYGLASNRKKEQFLFFFGLSIMLLAKGPVGWVLVLFPIALWALLSRNIKLSWQSLPWITGCLAAIAVVAPWYLLAEQRTPGFLHYFFVGEHWLRFTVSGWKGDLYGNAHKTARGTIWFYLIVSSLPWGLMAAWLTYINKKQAKTENKDNKFKDLTLYLLLAGISPCIFFTLSGNILWTYVLPGLPAFAVLLAFYLDQINNIQAKKIISAGVLLGCVAMIAMLGVLTIGRLAENKSAKPVVALYAKMPIINNEKLPLVFLNDYAFSMMFYSNGSAINEKNIESIYALLQKKSIYVALRKSQLSLFNSRDSEMTEIGQAGKYQLYLLKKSNVKNL